jgi:hypothetical protein
MIFLTNWIITWNEFHTHTYLLENFMKIKIMKVLIN